MVLKLNFIQKSCILILLGLHDLKEELVGFFQSRQNPVKTLYNIRVRIYVRMCRTLFIATKITQTV